MGYYQISDGLVHHVSKTNLFYLNFRFPLHDEELLQKWLNQIRIPNWIPLDIHQICSTHFHTDDIDFTPRLPVLKNNAVPIIFPLKHFQHIFVSDCHSVTRTRIRPISQSNAFENGRKYSKSSLSIPSYLSSDTFVSSDKILIAPNDGNSVSIPNNLSIKVMEILVVSKSNNKRLRKPWINLNKQINQPKLKIEIDKKIHKSFEPYRNPFLLNNVNQKNEELLINSYIEEVKIEDVSTSKVVIFKFDRSTGDIEVLKKEKQLINETKGYLSHNKSLT